MASAQQSSYASPIEHDVASCLGPYFSNGATTQDQDEQQEVADDLQLRAELSRSLAHHSHHDSPSSHDDVVYTPQQSQPRTLQAQHQPIEAQLQQPHEPQAQPPTQAPSAPPPQQQSQPIQGGHYEHQASPPGGQNAGDNKRSKVSRACDECRRKKIKCDAQSETEMCTNCRRSSSMCAFSRQPMKRGPSKGYIKELAERLNALEGQMQPQHEDQELQSLLAEADFVTRNHASPPRHAGQKRRHSQSDPMVVDGPPAIAPRPAPVATQYNNTSAHDPRLSPYPPTLQSNLRQQTPQQPTSQQFSHQQSTYPQSPHPQPPHQQSSYPQPTHQQSSYPQPTHQQSSYPHPTHQQPTRPHHDNNPSPSPALTNPQPFFKFGAEARRQESVSVPYSPDPNITTLISWDEEVVDEYYRIIHQTFPLLPHSKHRLRQRLAECPITLREAFLTVLECTMRTFPSSTLHANHTYAPMMKRAAELLAGYPFENPATHNSGTNLVYLQTLLLMALESDNHGPATVRGQAGPSRAEWLGRAAGVAGHLEINLVRPRERFATEGDPDSEERLARRVWWVLFILDRWHASSTSDLLKLPENSIVLLPEDQILLGESTYHLARLSFIIGHLAAILTTTKTPETNVMAPSNPASSLLGLTLAGEIDRFRESVESVWGSLNLVHLSYHHCHLLIKRLNPQTEPTSLISHAVKIATVLNQRQTPITPLNHHFAALAAMTLCELVDIEKTRAEAIRGLASISEALGFGRGLAGHENSSGWDSAIRDLIVQKRGKLEMVLGGVDMLPDALKHLAEAVPGEYGLLGWGGDGGGGGGGIGGGIGGGVGVGGGMRVPSSRQGNVAATSAVGGDGRMGTFDPTLLTRYGYLMALGQGMFVSK